MMNDDENLVNVKGGRPVEMDEPQVHKTINITQRQLRWLERQTKRGNISSVIRDLINDAMVREHMARKKGK